MEKVVDGACEIQAKYKSSIYKVVFMQRIGDSVGASAAFHRLLEKMTDDFLTVAPNELTQEDQQSILEKSDTFYAPAVACALLLHKECVTKIKNKYGYRSYVDDSMLRAKITQVGRAHTYLDPFESILTGLQDAIAKLSGPLRQV